MLNYNQRNGQCERIGLDRSVVCTKYCISVIKLLDAGDKNFKNIEISSSDSDYWTYLFLFWKKSFGIIIIWPFLFQGYLQTNSPGERVVKICSSFLLDGGSRFLEAVVNIFCIRCMAIRCTFTTRHTNHTRLSKERKNWKTPFQRVRVPAGISVSTYLLY